MITDFIIANLDRIERLALAAEVAHGYAWEADGTGNVRGPGGFPVVYVEDGAPEPPAAAHIALNDPDHVRTWVAGLRAVVEMHRPNICPNPEHPHDATCDECLDEWPCPTSRALAGIFADQPGWDEAWA